jgi:hypothetical protein
LVNKYPLGGGGGASNDSSQEEKCIKKEAAEKNGNGKRGKIKEKKKFNWANIYRRDKNKSRFRRCG